ncbi:MAG: NYN domain-containing protein, partial [Planctomycetaceae bacterium]|nr:NYN domain-containing protein [Planctomycetaceae bacterium]
MERVIAYIDGYNLYYGIKEGFSGRYKWLDLVRLSNLFLTKSQRLEKVKYFTADISSNNPKMARQKIFLNALECHCGDMLEITKGHYLKKEIHCTTYQHTREKKRILPQCINYYNKCCNGILNIPEEKKTDVNIATSILMDCFQNHFDTVFLISADSDLVPPLQAIKLLTPQKKIVVLFPPSRGSSELRQLIGHQQCRSIKEKHLKQSQLPATVYT